MSDLKEYRVVWKIDLSASSPREAAKTAAQWLRKGLASDSVFQVRERKIPRPRYQITLTLNLEENHE